jgi:LacI family repressor for deo operon, udp, cdd, tsx, nupC, and nupG
MGFDDIAFARYTVPPLTTVAQPVREMGQETVRLLIGIIKGKTLAPVSVILSPSPDCSRKHGAGADAVVRRL